MNSSPAKKRVVHVVYSFSIGGLENVIVQLINRLPRDRFDHVVLSLTTVTDFRNRIERSDVRFIELHKPPGHAWRLYPRIVQLLRALRPDVVHSCNLAALELAPLAWLAGVPRRVHAEHGWDVHDTQGHNRRYQWLRRVYRPFVTHYVSVSKDLDAYLAQKIGIPARRRSLIANGVDTARFSPSSSSTLRPSGCPFGAECWLMGTVGRMQTVKNQVLLARAFVRLLQRHPSARERVRLVMVGDGPLRGEVERILDDAVVRELAWLPGARQDVPDVLRALHCFVLPSQTEGTSCTLQEAMASGLPIVATAVGGTPDLVDRGRTGELVPPDDVEAMAEALWRYANQPALAQQHGAAARTRAIERFGIDAMIARYEALFEAA